MVHPVITSHQATPTPGLRTSWLVDDYFHQGPRQRAWMGSTVIWFHRTVEAYVRELAGAGFRLTGLRKCEPMPMAFNGDAVELERRRRVPLFFSSLRRVTDEPARVGAEGQSTLGTTSLVGASNRASSPASGGSKNDTHRSSSPGSSG